MDGRGVGVLLAHLDAERRAGDVHAVELGVDGVDAVLARHEAHGVRVLVDELDEAVVLGAAGGHDLQDGHSQGVAGAVITANFSVYLVRTYRSMLSSYTLIGACLVK